ncbi:MAG: class I SAM-dependent methyltransferase [Solirubrobacterales bacterium]
MAQATRSVREAVRDHSLWYHTLELGDGVVTPGWFDLRPVVERMPWPDVAGKRCLDIGTWDGFLAFELERRGAAEVVATDISDPAGWDWALRFRELGPEVMAAMAGEKTGTGFEIAKQALGSSAERVEINIYDLDPERVGSFDVVVCGSLLLHLRDPVRALEAVRGVCRGMFLSAEQVNPRLSAIHRRLPVASFAGGDRGQWWVPNVAAHRRLVEAGGFAVERATGAYAIPLGEGHPQRGRRRGLRGLAKAILGGGRGLSHGAVLATPERFGPDQPESADDA